MTHHIETVDIAIDENLKIIERIKQLLKMAADVSSPNEAAIAAGRARKLMDKHQIDLSDLKDESTGFGFQKADKPYRFMPLWKNVLSVAVGKFNDCKVTQSHEYKTSNNSYSYRIMFQGFEPDVIIAVSMYEHLCDTINRLCAIYLAELNHTKYMAKLGDAYKKSASVVICDRLRELQKSREKEFINSNGTALVLFKMTQVNKEFGEAKYTNKPLPTLVDRETLSAQRRGKTDAASISLNIQIDE